MALEPRLVLFMEAPALQLERLCGEILLVGALAVVEDVEEGVGIDTAVEARVVEGGEWCLGIMWGGGVTRGRLVHAGTVGVGGCRAGECGGEQVPRADRVVEDGGGWLLRDSRFGRFERLDEVGEGGWKVVDGLRGGGLGRSGCGGGGAVGLLLRLLDRRLRGAGGGGGCRGGSCGG